MFTHFMDIIYLNTKIFKIKYQMTENYFLIQIINNFEHILHVNIDINLNKNSRNKSESSDISWFRRNNKH